MLSNIKIFSFEIRLKTRGQHEWYPGTINFKRWVPLSIGTSQTKIFGYRRVPGTSAKNFLDTDEYRVPTRKFFWLPVGTGNRLNFQRCRPLLKTRKQVISNHEKLKIYFFCEIDVNSELSNRTFLTICF